MTATTKKEGALSGAGWRMSPGFSVPGNPRMPIVASFIADFLEDRNSPCRFASSPLPAPAWGSAPPFERVARSLDDLRSLGGYPDLLDGMLTVVEPWPHVGVNALGEQVRASLNVAYDSAVTADIDALLLPLWELGVGDPGFLADFLARSLAVVLEGGAPSVFDPTSFAGSAAPRADLFGLYERLLLRRHGNGAPCIFICVSHQLACECLVRLIRRAVAEVLHASDPADTGSRARAALEAACARIEKVGGQLRVEGRDGRLIAGDWMAEQFVNTRNDSQEVGATALRPYRVPHHEQTTVPGELLDHHALLAEAGNGVVDAMLAFETQITADMFHSNIVNEEAMLFANWAFATLHRTLAPHRSEVAASRLNWMLGLPSGVEIVATTMRGDRVETACSSTCIYYTDAESGHTRRSWTCQFHPELQADLRDFAARPAPSFAELKQDDGARLLMRLLRAGLAD